MLVDDAKKDGLYIKCRSGYRSYNDQNYIYNSFATLLYGDFMNFETEKISTLFQKIFIPTLLGMISLCAITAIDGMFVGHSVGSDGIAAINITVPLFMVFTGIGLMSGIGSSVIASVALAKGKIKLARLNVSQSLLFVSFWRA